MDVTEWFVLVYPTQVWFRNRGTPAPYSVSVEQCTAPSMVGLLVFLYLVYLR
ncbi:hypothetical protein BDV37DRAFT_248542 [Aspergillus pseudonomiae]|uniref:Uncharacterized protein n=1 Tax=Aspergillus pseudonomiae TaxID=1506151 RepID=A0A5N7DC71_9EURO|nr:uncharacterized protein BDV37DRAFT_248542 [Aspergillus pseudonomiae]KAE8403992.1 hypothetical protein BDV37DRAFT_248542 [Aspergillus pseudonomiae]